MANKGIIVDDAASGESVACADLRNNDDDENSRIVQLTSNTVPSTSHEALEDGTATRTLDFSTSGDKGAAGEGDYNPNLYSSGLPSGITSNLLDISDCSAFSWTVTLSETEEGVIRFYVTPILFNDAGTKVIGILPVVNIRSEIVDNAYWGGSDESSPNMYAETLRILEPAEDGIIVSPVYISPTIGAKYVGFAITASESNDSIVKIFAKGLAGEMAQSALMYAMLINDEGTNSNGISLGIAPG